ncbi:hypothetical protein F5Y07DRAFT_25161 [Xylaria sp. FL0933]|nr:hypothetical protein F5Y07DRAFT_25161 [Xylaria sp. FL0933]
MPIKEPLLDPQNIQQHAAQNALIPLKRKRQHSRLLRPRRLRPLEIINGQLKQNRRREGQKVGCLIRDADYACEAVPDSTLHGALLVRLTRLVDALVVRVQRGRSKRGGRRTQPAPLGDAAVILKMLRLSYTLDKRVCLQHRVRRRDGATTGRRRERLLDSESPAQRYQR